ncbi:type I-G CRISPR-associated protein Cas8g2 [Methylomagnum sp.]
MGRAAIPVDVLNPGQVLACLGFLEAADQLAGSAEGGFEWDAAPRFVLRADGAGNPFADVLAFLAGAEVHVVTPAPPDDSVFPSPDLGDAKTFPVRLQGADGAALTLSHWGDGSGRDTFKLYAGPQVGSMIADRLLQGTRTKRGEEETPGVAGLWRKAPEALTADPFGQLCSIAGRFYFDAGGAWNSLEAGYSVYEVGHQVQVSPVLELLAALGLEHARPAELDTRLYRYAIWGGLLPPPLARAAVSGDFAPVQRRRFRFPLALSGKIKMVCYATEECNRTV